MRMRPLFRRPALLAALWACGGGRLHAADLVAPLVDTAPTLDGTIGEEEWSRALRVDGMAWQGVLERRRAAAYLMATSTHIYIAIRSQLPAEGTLLTDVKRDSENLVYDDSVEVWLDPTPGSEAGYRYQMLANALGHRWHKQHAYGGMPEQTGWRGDWQVASGLRAGEWHCEIGIPVAQVAAGRASGEGAWGVNVCRNWKQEWAWSSLGGGPYRPTERVTFSRELPTAAFLVSGDPFTGDINLRLQVRNRGSAARRARMTLVLERDLMPTLREVVAREFAPGAAAEAVLKAADAATRAFTLRARAETEEGAVLFERELKWSAAPPWVWKAAKREIAPLDLRYAYYPYANQLRALIDGSNLPKGARLTGALLVVRKKGGGVVKSLRVAGFTGGTREVAMTLPALHGEYEIVLTAEGPGVPTGAIIRPFERTRFPWERTSLGTSRKVYPPFTPLRFAGSTLHAVLREHALDAGGLWKQVRATGRELLAQPMRYEATVGGRPVAVRAESLRVAEAAPDRVVTRSRFRAGTLTMEQVCTWEVDGMMRVDLTLLPMSRSLDKLLLVVPLRAEQAALYHAMGDGIRNTLYAELPSREGVVWTSREVACNDLPAGFCSYLFVGTPLRGLCWFAENDRGWRWNPNTPNVELIRRGKMVEMRIHLVNVPGAIAAPRTLTFGLLAAPVKPRLGADWRHKYRRDNYHLLGTDINWLALGDCGSVYPAQQDLFLWRMLAKGNRERVSEEDVRRTIERARPYFAPYGEERVKSMEAHVRHNLNAHLGAKMIFYYNRASFQLAPEFETFKDEWSLTDYRSVPKGNGIWEIKIVPTRSYIDHAVWWYARSFEIGGNRGVYWDNWFFAPSYNTRTHGAYRRGDGTIVPSTGLWGLRELAKRTFQMMNERGMLPITMAHMTSTGILPLLSFCTVQYDWEWKYSEGDVQDRYSRPYLLLVSNGEHAGTWPVLLNDHGPQAEDPWVARTFAGVAMVHELDCPYPEWSPTGKMQRSLFAPIDALLRRPGLRVHRYWDESPGPVRSSDPDVPVIVYYLPGVEAVVGVTSYAREDRNVELTVDRAMLRLPAEFRALDAQTGAPCEVRDGRIPLVLKKHDVKVLRLLPR